jgi:hypothetical protein
LAWTNSSIACSPALLQPRDLGVHRRAHRLAFQRLAAPQPDRLLKLRYRGVVVPRTQCSGAPLDQVFEDQEVQFIITDDQLIARRAGAQPGVLRGKPPPQTCHVSPDIGLRRRGRGLPHRLRQVPDAGNIIGT